MSMVGYLFVNRERLFCGVPNVTCFVIQTVRYSHTDKVGSIFGTH